MKTLALAAALVVTGLSAPAIASDAAAPAAAPDAAAAPAAAGKISVETTKISDIVKNPEAKAVLEKILPTIPDYYAMISDMTLTAVAPQSQGQLDDAKLKLLQAEFDKLQ